MSGLGNQGFETTKEDVRRQMHDESAIHPGGDIPKGSNAAAMQSMVDQDNQSKAQLIEERKAALPLPDQPPVASDFNSADQRTVNVGSGGVTSDASNDLNEGAVGREGASGIPDDAVTREAKGKTGLEETTGKDYGYPQKNDPADTSKLP